MLQQQLDEMVAVEAGVRSGDDPEDLHRFRVAVRRCRSLLRASRRLLGGRLAGLDGELRWLGDVSGPVRDHDVLIEHVRDLAGDLDDDSEGAEAIIAALEAERERLRVALVDAVSSARYRNLIVHFRVDLLGLTLIDEDAGAVLGRIAEKEMARLRSAYEALGPSPPDEQLHAVRIKAKHARYAAELGALELGRPLARLAKAIKGLQDLIGVHQDAHVAEIRIRELATGEMQVAAGRIVETERTRRRKARKRLAATWSRVDRAAAKVW